MTIIEAIKNYIATNTEIQGLGGKIKVDFLSEDNNSFSIEPIPINPAVEEYINGGGTYQYAFNVVGKFPYSEEAMMNIENSGFFEEFAEWIRKNNNNGVLPVLDDGKTSESIRVTSNAYLFSVTQNRQQGRYQIPCLLIYEQEE